MATWYEVRYRTHDLTKSGKPSKSCKGWHTRYKTFSTLKKAQEFAAQLKDDQHGWLEIKPVEVDTTLFADIFHS